MNTCATLIVRYVGRTTQRLQERIKQHVPKAIRQKTTLKNREPIDLNQPKPNQIENAKQKVRLNSNQRAIQPFVGIQSVRMQLF